MKIAVAYHSTYGHTQRLANAVADGARAAGDGSVILVDVSKDVPWDELQSSDAIVFGCPTYMGSPSWVFKKFMEDSSSRWMKQEWADKFAAGFTNSSSQSGDKLNTLISLAVFAAQHSMLWVSLGLLPGNNQSTASIKDLNRLGGWMGAMAQSNLDQPAELAPPDNDLATAKHLGTRVAALTHRFVSARK